MESKQPSVLIIILNYGTYDLTLKMIESLHADLEYDNYSIMVVDNCSPNDSAKNLEQNSKKLDYLFFENKENAGYAAGNNIGIRYGIKNGFDYSLVLNNDVELRDKNVLSEMVKVAEADRKIGCVGPKIYTLNDSICAPYCRRPSLWNMTLGILGEKKYRNSHIDVSGTVYRIYGCCMLLRNKAMNEIDCMDERTFLYGEESILSERLMCKGYSTYYISTTSVRHKESASMKKMSMNSKKMKILEQEKSRELYLKEYRHFSPLARWLCHLSSRVLAFLR